MKFKKVMLFTMMFVFLMFAAGCNGLSTLNTSTTTEIQLFELPDLSNKNKSEIITALEGKDINYEFVLETNKILAEETFIRYGNGLSISDKVTFDTNITIFISTSQLVLPDLSGLTMQEISAKLRDLNIDYDIDIVTDNKVPDKTFSSYGEGYKIGDIIDEETEITVYIGYNSAALPDLTGMIERQIKDILTENNIFYEITYVENDQFPEGVFAEYKSYEIGDFYDEVSTIEVVVYKNSFTEASESLIISKYIDGEIDSAIEIYNPTNTAINLSDYNIAIYLAGSYDVEYEIALEDYELAPNETYLIVSTESEANLQKKADLRSKDLLFDGNDTIQLRYKNGTYIDTIYQIGDRNSLFNDETFIRREDVVSGTRSFDTSQWTSIIAGYYDYIGTHPIDIPDSPIYDQFKVAELVANGFDSLLGGMDLVQYSSVADGDTAYFSPKFLGDNRVRFIGNDTPETSPQVVDEPEPWGLEAKAYTKTILEYADYHGLPIYVQSDPDIGYTEGYGRYLGLIWVDLQDKVLEIDILDSSKNVLFTENLTGLILINYQLVKNGFSADEYSNISKLIINNRYLYRWFDEAEKFAIDNGLGIHE
ncbi:MAG: lamin tail domain-containing protein [Candidatus Izemoplasmatales bacterium]